MCDTDCSGLFSSQIHVDVLLIFSLKLPSVLGELIFSKILNHLFERWSNRGWFFMCRLTVQMDLTGSAGPDLSQEPGAPCGSTTYRRGSGELQLLSHAVPCPPRCWVRSRAERFTPAPQAAACLPGLQCQHWRTFLHCDFYCGFFFFFEFWSLLSGMLLDLYWIIFACAVT